MRLWHKDLIPVLPRQQLLGQWRECCAIAKSIAEKGTPGHILVNRIMDYDNGHFCRYTRMVFFEMKKRGYSCHFEKFSQYVKKPFSGWNLMDNDLFSGWHDERYLQQCVYNLQEKYDCGGISAEEWDKIVERFIYLDP